MGSLAVSCSDFDRDPWAFRPHLTMGLAFSKSISGPALAVSKKQLFFCSYLPGNPWCVFRAGFD
jgi:hypothetical protein